MTTAMDSHSLGAGCLLEDNGRWLMTVGGGIANSSIGSWKAMFVGWGSSLMVLAA